jgi:hypothetical protein
MMGPVANALGISGPGAAAAGGVTGLEGAGVRGATCEARGWAFVDVDGGVADGR